LIGGDVSAIAIHPIGTNRSYMFVNDYIRRTSNASSATGCSSVSWTATATVGWPRLLGPGALALDPRSGQQNIAVVTNLFGGPKISTDSAATFRQVTGLAGPVSSVYVDDAGYLFVGTDGAGVWRCNQPLPSPPPSPTPSTLACLSASNWSAVGSMSPAPRTITNLRVTHPAGANPTYWAATTSGLYRKTPTQDWTVRAGGGGYTVNEVETVPGSPHCVYTGFGFVDGLAQHRGGITFSSDNGATWTSLTAGLDLHQSPISDVVPVSFFPSAIMATSYGLGFWIYYWDPLPQACVPP
jgi:hypothetical protein